MSTLDPNILIFVGGLLIAAIPATITAVNSRATKKEADEIRDNTHEIRDNTQFTAARIGHNPSALQAHVGNMDISTMLAILVADNVDVNRDMEQMRDLLELLDSEGKSLTDIFQEFREVQRWANQHKHKTHNGTHGKTEKE